MDPVAPRAQLVEQVYDRLLQAICRRQLAPGARIAQEDLAERLAVSRQPISHALQRLKQQGLVRDAGRRGLVVAPIEADCVRCTRCARRSMPSLPGAPRVGSATPRGAGRTMPTTTFSRRRGRCSSVAAPPWLPATRWRWPISTSPFTASSTSSRANPVITEIARQQWSHIRRAIDVVLDDPDVHARVWDEHAAILSAIAAGDAARAERLAREHATRAGQQTWQRLTATAEASRRADAAA